MGLSETPRPPTTIRRNPPRRARQSLLPSPSVVKFTSSRSSAATATASTASTSVSDSSASTTAAAATSALASDISAPTTSVPSTSTSIISSTASTTAAATSALASEVSAPTAAVPGSSSAAAHSDAAPIPSAAPAASSPATADARASISASASDIISPFPLDDLLHADSEPPHKPDTTHPSSASTSPSPIETLKVFLRVRPLELQKPRPVTAADRHLVRSRVPPHKGKCPSPRKSKGKRECLVVNNLCSVTLSDPRPLNVLKSAKTEVFEGFSFVFSPESSQKEVYDKVMHPIVKDFLEGKGALLAAMGPTGSGKTHTILGSSRNPGIVRLALRHLFSLSNADSDPYLSRSFYLSMFEIQSEGGKCERMLDLSPDGGDLSLHQSSVQGLREVVVSSVIEAENLLARGMLKRCTATTNANSQSSRSQCVINIRRVKKNVDNGVKFSHDSNVLRIADLAGSERERRTGNQGVRLLESSFINNTSMVLGLCLRSLLEHQKNPKKPLQKHFKNSMLTRFLKEYLEGKKRMTLILNVKSGADDYLDTSFFLRQVSPYTRIKYSCPDDLPNLPSRRKIAVLTRDEMAKRRKFNCDDPPLVDRGLDDNDGHDIQQIPGKECPTELIQELILREDSSLSMGCSKVMDADKEIDNGKYIVQKLISTNTGGVKSSPQDSNVLSARTMGIKKDNLVYNETHIEQQKVTRNEEVMMSFAKALWNVLKEYKQKLEVSENEVQGLKATLEKERAHVMKLKREMKDLRSASCYKHHSLEVLSSQLATGNSVQSHADSYEISFSNREQSSMENDPTLSPKAPDGPVTTANDHIVIPFTKETPVDADTPGDDSITHPLAKETCCNLFPPQEGLPQQDHLTINHEKKNYTCGGLVKQENDFSPSPASAVKPKRRLLPASTLLRKEFGGIDMEAEIKENKTTATRGLPVRSQGSTQLIRLLKENFHH